MSDRYRIVFGDIHNHNAHGYGQGSIERSVEIARTHLDFYAFTGHACWHDLRVGDDKRLAHFTQGFERLAQTWPRVQNVIAAANRDDVFVAFLGFEWHSNFYGDQCVIFPDDNKPICYAQDFDELRAFCREHDAILLPHHVAYPRGVRGANWDVYDPTLAPVVEIYSMHGCSESDRGGYPMKMGSPGGRSTSNTIAAAMARGLRFGFTASTDSHRGFPGAWGEGLMAALVDKLDRPSVWAALQSRRTYALTGDRIEIDFTVDGAVMGSAVSAGNSVEVAFEITARDEIALAEIIQDNEVVAHFIPPRTRPEFDWDEPFQLRLEWGWGPWGDLDTPRTVDWDFNIQLHHMTMNRHFPCLVSNPFDEDRRHCFSAQNGQLSVHSYSSRREAFNGNPNQAVVMELTGGPESALALTMTSPAQQSQYLSMAELAERSREFHTGPYPSESYQFHRLVPRYKSHMAETIKIPIEGKRSNIYLRVTQKNGQMAWSSPVFVN